MPCVLISHGQEGGAGAWGKAADGMEGHQEYGDATTTSHYSSMCLLPKPPHAATAERVGITVNAVFAQLEFEN